MTIEISGEIAYRGSGRREPKPGAVKRCIGARVPARKGRRGEHDNRRGKEKNIILHN